MLSAKFAKRVKAAGGVTVKADRVLVQKKERQLVMGEARVELESTDPLDGLSSSESGKKPNEGKWSAESEHERRAALIFRSSSEPRVLGEARQAS